MGKLLVIIRYGENNIMRRGIPGRREYSEAREGTEKILPQRGAEA
jgi:hypothetical protein